MTIGGVFGYRTAIKYSVRAIEPRAGGRGAERIRYARRIALISYITGAAVIKKVTLRHWRSVFARNLRLLGVEANATERAVRGENRKAKKDGIYRANQRGDSTYVRAQAEAVAAETIQRNVPAQPAKRILTIVRFRQA